MYEIMDKISPVWEEATLFERESFITHSCAELIIEMCDVREAKGLEVIHNNLTALVDFVEEMQYELEVRSKKDKLDADFAELCSDIQSNGFDGNIAERLAAFSEAVKEYAEANITAEDCEQTDEDAYENVKALIERTALAVGE